MINACITIATLIHDLVSVLSHTSWQTPLCSCGVAEPRTSFQNVMLALACALSLVVYIDIKQGERTTRTEQQSHAHTIYMHNDMTEEVIT